MALTELDMINGMLATTGSAPLTAGETTHPNYIKALAKLATVNVSAQKMRLWYNTYVKEYTADGAGLITFSSSVLSADPVDESLKYVKRGNKLWNQVTQTDVFDVGYKIKILIVEQWALTDIPEAVQFYIRSLARYEFYLDEDGTEPKLSRYEKEKVDMWTIAYNEHITNSDVNYFRGNNTGLRLKRNPGYRRLRFAPYE